MDDIRAFCREKLLNYDKINKINLNLKNIDARKRLLKDNLLKYMMKNKYSCIQIKNNNDYLQARITKSFKYDIPTSTLISNLELDWNHIFNHFKNKEKRNELVSYLFKNIQQARRTPKQSICIKPCGIRNRKKIKEIHDESIKTFIIECNDLTQTTTTSRTKRKAMLNNKSSYYQSMLDFMKKNKTKYQSFNVKDPVKNTTNKLIVRRVKSSLSNRVTGKTLKIILNQCFEEFTKPTSSEKLKNDFIKLLIDKIINLTPQSNERLVYEINKN